LFIFYLIDIFQSRCIRGVSPDECWMQVLESSTTPETRNLVLKAVGVSGASFFGLDQPPVMQSINMALAQIRMQMQFQPSGFSHMFHVNSSFVKMAWVAPTQLPASQLQLPPLLNVPQVDPEVRTIDNSAKRKRDDDYEDLIAAKRQKIVATEVDSDAATNLVLLFSGGK
jgi:hypothetical protein